MRPYAFLATALTLASGVMAVDQMKSFIIWTDNTSITQAMIDSFKAAIVAAKGQITHVYNMPTTPPDSFRGFAAVAPQHALDEVRAMQGANLMNVEEDQVVSG